MTKAAGTLFGWLWALLPPACLRTVDRVCQVIRQMCIYLFSECFCLNKWELQSPKHGTWADPQSGQHLISTVDTHNFISVRVPQKCYNPHFSKKNLMLWEMKRIRYRAKTEYGFMGQGSFNTNRASSYFRAKPSSGEWKCPLYRPTQHTIK